MRYPVFGLAAALSLLTVGAGGAQAPAYKDHEVTFTSGAVTLAGTLSVPDGKGPFPAVVLLSGSGAQNRDSEILGFRPFKLIAAHLAAAGIAVLRCDDRGIGGSSGSVPASTTEDFAADALAAVALLRGRPDIRADAVGLIGHSEGALAGSLAAKSSTVAFLVSMAGSTLPGGDILRAQALAMARTLGATAEATAAIETAHRRAIDAVRRNASDAEIAEATMALARAQIAALPEAQRKAIPNVDAALAAAVPAQTARMRTRWMRFFLDFDPAEALAQVACPVLALFGGKDLQVEPSLNRPVLEAALARGGNRQVSVRVYPDANHLFQKAVTGSPAEYATLEKVFVPGLLDDIASWITAQAR